MKVVLVNGSPNANGCTYTGLSIIKEQLLVQGVESEIFQVGNKPIIGCTGCRVCKQPGKAGKCVYDNDMVNTVGQAIREADGIILGSAVHFASATGAATSVRILKTLANNMAYLIKCKHQSKVELPEDLPVVMTSFIR